MRLRNGTESFGAVAKTFHWLTFLLLLASFGIGLTMVDLPLGPGKLKAYSWHKWVGVTIFLVTIVRLGWRCADPPPPLPETMPPWQRLGARLSHAGLYGVLLVMPISGWLTSSALGLATVYFGLVPLPDLVAPDRALGQTLSQVHGVLAVALVVLFAGHVGAALYHHIGLKDGVLRRMVPFMSLQKGVGK